MPVSPPLENLPPGAPFLPWLGAWETLLVRRGRAVFVEEHWAAFTAACAALGLTPSADLRPAAALLPPATDGRWRWICDASGIVRHLFQVEAPALCRARALVCSAVRVGSRNLDARHKTFSYLAHWQAQGELAAPPPPNAPPVLQANLQSALGHRQSFAALLLNELGEIASAAMANIFWTRAGRLFTPALACGCRAGVTRAWVLHRIPTEEVAAPPTALDCADEIFLTSSIAGPVPINAWNGRRLASGPVFRRLRREWLKE